MAEVHKSVVNSFYDEVLTQKKVDQAGEFVAEDYVDHGGLPGQAPGLEGAKAKWSMYFAAVPDTRTTIEDMLADGDKVAVRWTGEGTHRGDMLGIPSTGKPIRVGGLSIYRLSEGKIAEVWEQWDMLGLMQELGVVVIPGPRLLVRMLVRQAKKVRARLPAAGR